MSMLSHLRVSRWQKKTVAIAVACLGVAAALSFGAYANLGGAPRLAASGDVALQRGLIGWWKLDANAKDSTPYGANGTINGSPSSDIDRKGASGKAYTFGGSPQSIVVANFSSQLVSASAMSISGWVKPPNNPVSNMGYFGMRNNTDADFYTLQQAGTNILECRFRGSGGVAKTISSMTITPNVWQLVTFVYDGSNLRCYVNQTGSSTLASTDTITNAAVSFNMGSTNGIYLQGSVDDVRVYNRALSAAEVTALVEQYDSGVKAGAGENGLVGNWKLDGNAKDATPNANNGTVTGATLTTDRKGRASSAYAFDGTTTYIRMPSSNHVAAGTVTLWVKPSSTQPGSNFFIFSNPRAVDNSRVYIRTNVTGTALEGLLGDGTSIGTGAVSADNWHFVVLKWSGTTAAFLVDGIDRTTTSTFNGLTTVDPFYYLGCLNVAVQCFAGSIDDVKVYNRSLSAAELAAMYKSYDSQIGSATGLSKGLIGYWPLNGNPKDATPNANNGTITAATATTDRKSRANAAYLFNGTSAYIDVADTALLDLTAKVSMSAWVKGTVAVTSDIKGIACKDQDSGAINNTPYCLAVSSGEFRFSVTSNADVQTTAKNPLTDNIQDNTWYHLVGTYDGTDEKIYVNGVLRATTPLVITLATTDGSFRIGRQKQTVGTRYFAGSIDEVMLWNRALSATEVQALYSSYH